MGQQLVINTETTIVPFPDGIFYPELANDSAAIQVKLDEVIRAGDVANAFTGIEHLTVQEIEELLAEWRLRSKENKRKRPFKHSRQDSSRFVQRADLVFGGFR